MASVNKNARKGSTCGRRIVRKAAQANGQVKTRNEHRLHVRQNRWVLIRAGMTKAPLAPSDRLTEAEAATAPTQATALRKAVLAWCALTVTAQKNNFLCLQRLILLNRLLYFMNQHLATFGADKTGHHAVAGELNHVVCRQVQRPHGLLEVGVHVATKVSRVI